MHVEHQSCRKDRAEPQAHHPAGPRAYCASESATVSVSRLPRIVSWRILGESVAKFCLDPEPALVSGVWHRKNSIPWRGSCETTWTYSGGNGMSVSALEACATKL